MSSLPGASRPVAARSERLTRFGVGLFVAGALFLTSGSKSVRLEVGGLLLHLSLIPLFLLLILALPRLTIVPRNVLLASTAFLAAYAMASLQAGFASSETAKIAASLLVLLSSAISVRSVADFRAATLGLMFAVAVLAVRGLADVENVIVGANPLEEVANKNAFSMYVLPALLLAGAVLLEPRSSRVVKLLLAGLVAITLTGLFSTGNRSGWAGAVLVVAMLYLSSNRVSSRLRATISFAVLGLSVYAFYYEFGQPTVVEHRINLTLTGYSSDTFRWELLTTSLDIGLENIFFGIGPQQLPYELARRLYGAGAVDPHNVIALLFGGGGLFLTIAFMALAYALWGKRASREHAQWHASHNLLHMMMALWMFRGMFSREILYSPSFSLGLGLALGLSLLQVQQAGTIGATPPAQSLVSGSLRDIEPRSEPA